MHLRLSADARVALQYRCAVASCAVQACEQQLQVVGDCAERGCAAISMGALRIVHAQVIRERIGKSAPWARLACCQRWRACGKADSTPTATRSSYAMELAIDRRE